jgi:RNA polymerase sigma-70 factor (ECF subfamily)
MSDGELVRQALSGRSSAYGELARRWSASILAFCHAKVRSVHAAEDLAQESLLRGLRALPTLSDPEKFGAWLRGIALRVCLDWLKSKQTRQVTLGPLSAERGEFDALVTSDAADPGQAADRAEQIRLLMAEVEALPDEYREVVMHYYYQDVTYRQLADALGVSAATVNARLTKARAMLRERLTRSPR